MYNVLEKLRRGEQLNERERVTQEQGLVSVLRRLHEDLDAAVFDAYGWPTTLSDEDILERLVRLNAERAAEERAGLVRWLRPEFQKPAAGVAAAFGEEFQQAVAPVAAKQERQLWPKPSPNRRAPSARRPPRNAASSPLDSSPPPSDSATSRASKNSSRRSSPSASPAKSPQAATPPKRSAVGRGRQ
jgi:hypothetical protein